ncbi:MAG TPA: sulfatase-like hydrolase/transferase, partial [Rubrobacter sp.]|nr:sulfatase-like hydrolase/transferase [Rubrobacter sp.]
MKARNRTSPPSKKASRAALLLASMLSLLLVGCGVAAETEMQGGADAGEDRGAPNIIVIPTDDLATWDLDAAALEKMPNIREELIEKGTAFENAFVTNSVCCPSRATFLRGQYSHNHQVLSNGPPLGGAGKFRLSGGDSSTAATWLGEAGYKTAFFGKYLNAYGGTYVPPGWDEWHAVSGNFLSNSLNENGFVRDYDPDRYHLDDVLSEKASDYVKRTAGAEPPFYTTDRPFF